MAFDLDSFNNITSGAAKGVRIWGYKSTTDTMATVLADDYFLQMINALDQGDLIYIQSSDGRGQFYVNTATGGTVVLGASEGAAYTNVTVSSAEMLTLRATPKQLVPAPGAGKILMLDSAWLQLDFNTSAYTESTDNMAIKYTDASGVTVSIEIEATGFVDATVDTSVRALPVLNATVANSAAENQALVLNNIGDGEYASGDSPVLVNIYYRVINGV